jgi:uncharacterized protein (DUF4415 family)
MVVCYSSCLHCEVSMARKSVSFQHAQRVAVNAASSDSQIDFSDAPERTVKELRDAVAARAAGRPLPGDRLVRQMIAIRLDTALLRRLRAKAAKRRIGYQTLIHEILTRHVR